MSSRIKKSTFLEFLDEMENVCSEQLDFLSKKINKGHFSGCSFYGELFTALAMILFDDDAYEVIISQILDWYVRSPKNDSNFHWEFNNYALLKIRKKNEKMGIFIEEPLTYRGTKCTNWSLLRIVGKMMEGRELGNDNPQKIIEEMQLPNGLMLDESHVASFQYHCFMMALICDIYELTGKMFFLNAFKKGVEFISNFTFPNGDTLYIGRGQEQIFGYGTLLYIYSKAYDLFGNYKYICMIRRVFAFIQQHWSEERMLPLVLNEYEKDSEQTLEMTDRRHLGWYSYNNFYDYLPFFTYFLAETVIILRKHKNDINVNSKKIFISENYCDNDFLHYTNTLWDMAMSCRKGASANALVFPLIVYKGQEITSICGGDDYVDVGYYQMESVPLPFGRYSNTYLHMLDSKSYLKKKIRSIVRKKAIYANVYLWEDGTHCLYMNETKDEFGMESESVDYNFRRGIRCVENRIIVKDTIKFNRNVNYDFFVSLKLVFPSIEEDHIENCYKISGGRLIFLNDIKPIIHQKEYMTAKTEVDSIQICFYNYKAKSGDEIVYEYMVEANE